MIENCYGADRLTQDTGASEVKADPKWFTAKNVTAKEVSSSRNKDPRFAGIGRNTYFLTNINQI